MAKNQDREHLRFEGIMPLKFRTKLSGGWRRSEVKDIGTGGLSFLVFSGLWIAGLSIDIEIDLPLLSLISASGRITRVKKVSEGKEIAVQFTSLNEKDQILIGRFILSRKRAGRG